MSKMPQANLSRQSKSLPGFDTNLKPQEGENKLQIMWI